MDRGKRIVDEQVRCCHGRSDNELGDLHGSQGALDDSGNANAEGSQGVIGILFHFLR